MRRDSIAGYLEADISCFHCGDTVGLIRRAHGVPGAPTLYLDPARGVRGIVKRLTDLHCARCRGPVYPSTLELRRDPSAEDIRSERPSLDRPITLAG